jgi:septal ring-binding cell division protein DamX
MYLLPSSVSFLAGGAKLRVSWSRMRPLEATGRQIDPAEPRDQDSGAAVGTRLAGKGRVRDCLGPRVCLSRLGPPQLWCSAPGWLASAATQMCLPVGMAAVDPAGRPATKIRRKDVISRSRDLSHNSIGNSAAQFSGAGKRADVDTWADQDTGSAPGAG